MQLVEVGEQPLDVVERVRPAADGAPPGRAATASGARRARRGSRRRARRSDSIDRSRSGVCGSMRERLDLLQQDADRFFEFEQCQAWHQVSGHAQCRLSRCTRIHVYLNRRHPTPRDRTQLLDVRDQLLRRPDALRDVGADAQRRGRRSSSRRARATRGDRRGGATAARPAPRIVLARAAACQVDRHLARRPLLEQRQIGMQLGRDEPRRSRRRFSNLPRTSSMRVGLDQRCRCLPNVSGKTTTSTRAGDVVEHEDRHAVALLGLQRAQAADDAADPDVGRGLRCSSRDARARRTPSGRPAKRSSGWPLM